MATSPLPYPLEPHHGACCDVRGEKVLGGKFIGIVCAATRQSDLNFASIAQLFFLPESKSAPCADVAFLSSPVRCGRARHAAALIIIHTPHAHVLLNSQIASFRKVTSRLG